MLNHKAFGGLLMGIGITVVVTYFLILLVSITWALVVAVSVVVSIAGIMFFWLGFKVITSSQMSRAVKEETEKI